MRPPILLAELRYRLRVADVERYDLDALDLAQRIHAAEWLPRFGDANKQNRRSGRLERCHHCLTDRMSARRSSARAEISDRPSSRAAAGSSCMLGVGGSGRANATGAPLLSSCKLTARGRLRRIAMQMRHDGRPASSSTEPAATAHVRGSARRPRRAPWSRQSACRPGSTSRRREPRRKARRARIPRRIDNVAALVARLQDEAAFGRGRGKAVRGAAARARRRRRQPASAAAGSCARFDDRFDHELVPRGSPRPKRGRDHS